MDYMLSINYAGSGNSSITPTLTTITTTMMTSVTSTEESITSYTTTPDKEDHTSTNTTTPGEENDTSTYITVGAVIGAAAVAAIIAVTMILGIMILRKKNHKRKASINSTSKSEKSPNRDGYVNALYDSKSTKLFYSRYWRII